MKAYKSSFGLGLILAMCFIASLSFALDDHVNWPAILPESLAPLENVEAGQFFLLDQAAINNLADRNNGVITLVNQNKIEDNMGDVPEGVEQIQPLDYFDDVDYIIMSDLIFGDLDGEASADLVITTDDGDNQGPVTIWFALSSGTQEDPEGQIEVDEEGWYGYCGGITQVCKFVFRNEFTFTCGEAEGDPSIFTTWPLEFIDVEDPENIELVLGGLADYFIIDDALGGDWPNEDYSRFFWYDEEDIIHLDPFLPWTDRACAGGFIFESPGQHTIINTTFEYLIGTADLQSTLEDDPHGDGQLRVWDADPGDAYAIKLAGNGGTIVFNSSIIRNSYFHGIFIEGDDWTVNIEGGSVEQIGYTIPRLLVGDDPEEIEPAPINDIGDGISLFSDDNALIITNNAEVRSNFASGIQVHHHSGNDIDIDGATVIRNNGIAGIELDDCPAANTVDVTEASVIYQNDLGILVFSCFQNRINLSNVDINRNTTGISIKGGSFNRIDCDHCIIDGSEDPRQQCGIQLIRTSQEEETSDNIINLQNSTQIINHSINGIDVSHSDRNKINIGTVNGDCEINCNLGKGINLYLSDDNEIKIDNQSNVYNNRGDGILIQGIITDNVRNECIKNKIQIDNQSHVNHNGIIFGDPEDPEDPDVHLERSGIKLKVTGKTTVEVLDHSTVNNNGEHGIHGIASIKDTIKLGDNSFTNLNNKSGIKIMSWALSEDAYIARLCQVSLEGASESNQNKGIGGDDDNNGGVVMIGDRHTIILDNSTCNQNGTELVGNEEGGYGIRNKAYAGEADTYSRTFITNNSSVNGNGHTGINCVRCKELEVTDSEVQGNGLDGIHVVKPGTDGGSSSLTVNISGSTIGGEGNLGNDGDGIEIDGDRVFCEVFSINVGNVENETRIENSTENGLLILGVPSNWQNFTPEINLINSDFVDNNIGVYLTEGEWSKDIIVSGCEFTGNETAGIRLFYEKYTRLDILATDFDNNSTGVMIGDYEGGMDFCDGLDLRIMDLCTFTNATNCGIFVHGESESEIEGCRLKVLIEGATFNANEEAHIKFLGGPLKGWIDSETWSDHATIRKCYFENGNIGVDLVQHEPDEEDTDQPDVHIRNNYFVDVQEAGVRLEYYDFDDDNEGRTVIYNNTFCLVNEDEDSQIGVSIVNTDDGNDPRLDQESISFNIFSELPNSVAFDQDVGFTMWYNCFFDAPVSHCAEPEVDNGNILADPQFNGGEDPEERLLWTSPCINAATDVEYLQEVEIAVFGDTTVINEIEYASLQTLAAPEEDIPPVY
ncbi:MAG: hypothetical protein P9X24_10715 [Candidatus Hatepunaea meridiana]|nr:hypothetical protein [Candidatus Hatepunaea meridiana]